MGITAEKDAGEPFFKPDYPKGYDHYGFHLIINDIGVVKTVVLGITGSLSAKGWC